jgi:hypothetical protein
MEMTKRNRQVMSVTLSPHAKELCTQMAENNGITRSAYIELLLRGDARVQDFKLATDTDLHTGHWECVKSPLGRCQYDLEKDPAADSCIHCGDPEERK